MTPLSVYRLDTDVDKREIMQAGAELSERLQRSEGGVLNFV